MPKSRKIKEPYSCSNKIAFHTGWVTSILFALLLAGCGGGGSSASSSPTSTPPSISGLTNLTVIAGQSGTETFTLTGTGALTVTATSTNTTLLPNANITGESSCTTAGSCTLALTPAANQSGTSTVTVQVTNTNGQSATGNFSFTVKNPALRINFFGSGTVTSQPTGIDCTKNCSASFPAGTTVVLTAQPGANEKFADWGGCDSTSGSQCTVTLNANRLVLPTFASSAPVQMQPNVKTLDAATLQAITHHSGNTYYKDKGDATLLCGPPRMSCLARAVFAPNKWDRFIVPNR